MMSFVNKRIEKRCC